MTSGNTRWLDRDQQQSWRAYIMGTTLLLDRLDRELRATHDISLSEYEVMVRLSEQPDQRMRMALLAEAMCHSRSRVTHTISRMERADLVRRIAADSDGRGVEAVMTKHGREVLGEAAHIHVEGVREHLVDLASAADFAAVGRVFNAVSDQLLTDVPDVVDIR
jgi:DNA-binding MarR family transcriptional regulator